jgi:hypothetical protein
MRDLILPTLTFNEIKVINLPTNQVKDNKSFFQIQNPAPGHLTVQVPLTFFIIFFYQYYQYPSYLLIRRS